MKRTAHTLAALLAIATLLAMLGGCATDSGADTSREKPDVSVWDDDTTYTVKIFTSDNFHPSYPYSWDQYGMNKLKERALEADINLSFDIELTVSDIAFARTVLNTRFAANLDIPDIIRMDFNGLEANRMYNSGYILNLSDFEEYMPNTVLMHDDWPSLKLQTETPEGDILAFAALREDIQSVTYWGNIRIDWLEKVNLPMPVTTDDLRNVLKAFQDNNVNGRADKKEQYVVTAYKMNEALAPAFGAYYVKQGIDSWGVNNDGMIYHAMLTDEAYNYLDYVAGMFRDQLFWDGSLEYAAPAEQAMRSDDRIAGTFDLYWNAVIENMNAYTGNRRHAEYLPYYPLTDGTRDAKVTLENYMGTIFTYLTTKCQAPHRVIRFFDWLLSAEGSSTVYYGEPMPGGNYFRKVPVLDRMSTEEAAAIGVTEDTTTIEPTERLAQMLGANISNYPYELGLFREFLWPSYSRVSPLDVTLEYYFEYDRVMTKSVSDLIPNYQRLNWADNPDNQIQRVLFSVATEEQNEILNNAADLFAYIDEMFMRFMTGVTPLSQWNDFKAQCNSLGMEKVRNVYQARYDAIN